MRCDQAQDLFDTHLDGELAPALAAELQAHKLQCPDCRQALALLEVSGSFIGSDTAMEELDAGFTNRLLACLDRPRQSLSARIWHFSYYAVPIAAAAVITMAFLGLFNPETKVAGKIDDRIDQGAVVSNAAPLEDALVEDDFQGQLQTWRERFGDSDARSQEFQRQWGGALLQAFDYFGQEPPLDSTDAPNSAAPLPVGQSAPTRDGDEDIEDL